jgi:hypothetical protein
MGVIKPRRMRQADECGNVEEKINEYKVLTRTDESSVRPIYAYIMPCFITSTILFEKVVQNTRIFSPVE